MKLQRNLYRLILAVLVLSILLFILFPLVSVVSLSFFNRQGFTWEHYRSLFTVDNLELIGNSLFVAGLSSTITVFFALCLGLFIFTRRVKTRDFFKKLLMITMISPPFVSALALIILFGRRGIITHGILGLSVNPYGWQGIVLLQVVGSISFAALLLTTSFELIDHRLILASRDLGANPIKTLWQVILPNLKSGILSLFFVLFTMNLADFGTPIIIGGRFRVLATEAYLTVLSSSNLGKAAAMSMLMIPPALIAYYFYRRNLTLVENASAGNKLSGHKDDRFELPKALSVFLYLVVILYFLVMLLKYGNIFLSTISNTATGKLTFTLKYLKELPNTQLAAFWRSITYSITAGLLASGLGVLLAYFAHRRKLPGMSTMEFMASLPYIIPGTFFGLGYVAGFSQPPFLLRGTAWIVIFNLAFRQLSVTNKSANAEFDMLDEKLEDAARDLGAGPLQVLFKVVLPSLKGTLLTGFITTFTASMTAVGAIVFLISPGKTVASVEMFQSIENGRYGIGAVQAVLIILVTVTVNLIAMAIQKRMGRKAKEEVHVLGAH